MQRPFRVSQFIILTVVNGFVLLFLWSLRNSASFPADFLSCTACDKTCLTMGGAGRTSPRPRGNLVLTRLLRRPRQGPTAFIFNTCLHTIYSITDTKYSTMQQWFGAGENVEGMKLGRRPLLFSSSVDKLLRALRPAPFEYES
jgi:hypothetical protein